MQLAKRRNIFYIKKICIFLMMMSFLSGCQLQEKKGNITFIKDNEIEYSKDLKVSDLIIEVDNYSRKDFKINEDDTQITLPNGKTVAINTTEKDIELDTVKFTFRYMNKNFHKEVLIQDTTAPSIQCENEYKVKIHNEYFNLENLLECSDNFTSDEAIELYYNGNYDIDKVGTYDVEIIAYDQRKNKAIKKVKIIVEDEPKPQDQSDNHTSDGNEHYEEPSYNDEGSGGNPIIKPEEPPISNYIPQSRDFTIDSYSSFDECYSACQKYINDCMNQGYYGTATAEPIKRDGVYIGYRAIFY